MNKIHLYNFFILNVLISTFLDYFFDSGLIAYGPLIVMMFLVFLSEILKPSTMEYKDWLAALCFIPYAIFASYFYIII